MSLHQFPFTFEELKQSLIMPHLSEAEVISSLKKTQIGFTSSRDQINIYSGDEKRISSYALFYLPTDFPKLSFVLGQLESNLINQFNEDYVEIFDIGCGPGTFSFAWNDYFQNSTHQFTFIDQSPHMLKQAELINKKLFKLSSATFLKSTELNKIEKKKNKRVIIFGHSLNEMGIEIAKNYVKNISPDYVIALGPGTPSVFQLFMNFRKEMELYGKKIFYPCLNSNGDCPILKNPQDWCHQILRSKLSEDILRLSQKLSIDRRTIPFVGHVYGTNRGELGANFILVRYLGETKFSWRYLGCDQKSESLIELEFLKKSHSKIMQRKIMSLSVGNRLTVEVEKKVSPSHFRVICPK